MQSASKAIAIHYKNEVFKSWNEKALKALKKGESIRVPTKTATYILLHYPIIDDKYSTYARNIGAGVKELYVKEVIDG